MTPPRRVRLTRAPTLAAFRQALLALLPLRDIGAARSTAVIVPTRAAAALLQRTIEDRLAVGEAAVLPDVVTRREWYERLRLRAAVPPRALTSFERDVVMEAAAHEAITHGATPPFHLRSPLVREIVALYDAIRRHGQRVDDFVRLVLEPLAEEAEAGGDPGAERMLRQTRFLAATFQGYEARRAALEALDEHALRDWLLATPLSRPYRTVIVAVADETRDPNGLWSVDFDLLARLPDLQAVEIVATESRLATGLLERLTDVLPGITIERVPPPSEPLDSPRLIVPEDETARYYSSRDREEELRNLVRRIRTLEKNPSTAVPLSRVGVTFERPLPYLYLAREIFDSGGVPFHAREALPLAAEPFSAAVDLVLTAVSVSFTRTALTALLASPHFRFEIDPPVGPSFSSGNHDYLTREDIAALERALQEFDHNGDPDRLDALAGAWHPYGSRVPGTAEMPAARATATTPGTDAAGRTAARVPGIEVAARVAAQVIRELRPLAEKAPASAQLDRLRDFVERHLQPVEHDDPLRSRLLRAQQAVVHTIRAVADAHRAHHDLLWDLADLSADVRRWIEEQTFAPEAGEAGVELVDAASAPFGDFEALHLVGLVDGEWPTRRRRNIFYSPALLKRLGWPVEAEDALAPSRAAFLDLLQSPGRYASVASFALENDTLVEPSPLLDDIPRAGLSAVALRPDDNVVFVDEALSHGHTLEGEGRPTGASRWAALRATRPAASDHRFHGQAGAQQTRTRSASALELYAQCPFKFYARYVLRLAEEREEEDGLTPLERGRFQHQLFEAFFSAWQSRGHATITVDLLDEARQLAVETMEQALTRLSPSDAALERTRLLGSPAASGVIDIVLRMEAERPVRVVERRLEHQFDGVYTFRGQDGPRSIAVRGIADRIDLLEDGTFRVIDYKSSRPPTTLQIAIYATCARQALAGYKGRNWQVAEAAYVAFRGDKTVVPLASRPEDIEAALLEAENIVVSIVDDIGRGAFPPRPKVRGLCSSCAFAGVCRKDYVEAVEPAPAV